MQQQVVGMLTDQYVLISISTVSCYSTDRKEAPNLCRLFFGVIFMRRSSSIFNSQFLVAQSTTLTSSLLVTSHKGLLMCFHHLAKPSVVSTDGTCMVVTAQQSRETRAKLQTETLRIMNQRSKKHYAYRRSQCWLSMLHASLPAGYIKQ